MNLDHIDKNILAKIQKLVRLEEGAKAIGNFNEAANAAERIREILMKYNLELYQVQAQGDLTQKEEAITHQNYNADDLTMAHEGDWIVRLAKVIAAYNMCACWAISKTTYMNIVGTASNVEIVWYTVESLANRLRPEWKAAFRKYTGKEKRNTFMRGFLRGAVEGIEAQLAERQAKETWDAKQAEQSETKSEEQITSIMKVNMLVKNSRKISEYAENEWEFTSSKSRGLSGQNGKTQGYETGQKMGLHKGINHPGKVSQERWLK